MNNFVYEAKRYHYNGEEFIFADGKLFVEIKEKESVVDLEKKPFSPLGEIGPKKRKKYSKKVGKKTKPIRREGKKKINDDVIRAMKKEIDGGRKVKEVCDEYEISNPTYYNRVKKLGKGMPTDEEKNGVKEELEEKRKSRDYECSCGFHFRSRMVDPKCPDCQGTPKLVEEENNENI